MIERPRLAGTSGSGAATAGSPAPTFVPAKRPPGPPRRWPILLAGLAGGFVCVAAGLGLGLGMTARALHGPGGVGSVRIGAWSLEPSIGTPERNPYQRAWLARTGAVPLAAGQGMTLTATRDDAGAKLDRRCRYRLGGGLPPAQFWTLGPVDPSGLPLSDADARQAFTADNVLRDGDGHASVTLSPDAQPGNWLPLTGSGSFVLILRLYDTSLSALARRNLGSVPVPTLTLDGCL